MAFVVKTTLSLLQPSGIASYDFRWPSIFSFPVIRPIFVTDIGSRIRYLIKNQYNLRLGNKKWFVLNNAGLYETLPVIVIIQVLLDIFFHLLFLINISKNLNSGCMYQNHVTRTTHFDIVLGFIWLVRVSVAHSPCPFVSSLFSVYFSFPFYLFKI